LLRGKWEVVWGGGVGGGGGGFVFVFCEGEVEG